MGDIEPAALWAYILAAASAFVLLSNAGEKIVRAWKAAKAPNDKQDERLTALEKRMDSVEGKLDNDKDRLDAIVEGDKVIQRGVLALLDHGIDGNNIEQMQDAKVALQNHLIDR
jgi:hypothetical protein